MDAELTEHLGYERGAAPPGGAGHPPNGTSPKTVHTGTARIEQRATGRARSRSGPCPKHPRRFAGFDDKIIPPRDR